MHQPLQHSALEEFGAHHGRADAKSLARTLHDHGVRHLGLIEQCGQAGKALAADQSDLNLLALYGDRVG